MPIPPQGQIAYFFSCFSGYLTGDDATYIKSSFILQARRPPSLMTVSDIEIVKHSFLWNSFRQVFFAVWQTMLTA